MDTEIDEQFKNITIMRAAVEAERKRCYDIVCKIEKEFSPYERAANAARTALRDAAELIANGL